MYENTAPDMHHLTKRDCANVHLRTNADHLRPTPKDNVLYMENDIKKIYILSYM